MAYDNSPKCAATTSEGYACSRVVYEQIGLYWGFCLQHWCSIEEHMRKQWPTSAAPLTWVYFAMHAQEEQIKIGTTQRLKERLRALHASLLVAVPGGVDMEKAWHLKFRGCRLTGEWFQANDDVMEAVSELRRRPGAITSTSGSGF